MSKKQLLFVHSAGSQEPQQGSNDFVGYLQRSLPQYQILYPIMPSPESPAYEAWKIALAKEIEALDDNSLIAGHSLGGSVVLKYLSETRIKKRIKALFFIATPYWGKEGWEVNEYILREGFASKLPPAAEIYLYYSMADDVVPISHMEAYSSELPNALVRKLSHYPHDFHTGLPELVDDIKRVR